ncbi:MAG: tyrosine-type recombinase/integrase, partial [Haloquadratum sp.]
MGDSDTTAYVCEAPLVTEPTREKLNQRQLTAYREYRRDLLTWMRDLGKNPDRGKGYAAGTVYNRAYRIDAFYRWLWEDADGYTTHLTHEDCDRYCRELLKRDCSDSHRATAQKALKTLCRFHECERGLDEWDPEITFTGASPSRQPRDYFTREERGRLREAALEYGSVPHYNSLTSAERTTWKRHLAQRFGVPMADVGPDHFERANGWKVPSLIQTALDAGLRPKEVHRATVGWVDVDNEVLRIPPEDATKSNDAWTVAIRTQTAEALQRWLHERECYEKYDDADALWLTREGNPYGSTALNRLLENLCEEADIDTSHRDLTFYAIRHSVGSFLTDERDLEAARVQLRHGRPTGRAGSDGVADAIDAPIRIGFFVVDATSRTYGHRRRPRGRRWGSAHHRVDDARDHDGDGVSRWGSRHGRTTDSVQDARHRERSRAVRNGYPFGREQRRSLAVVAPRQTILTSRGVR